MNEIVKKEIEIQISQINRDLRSVIDRGFPAKEFISSHFIGIRMLVDYCERLALEGENALGKSNSNVWNCDQENQEAG